MRLKITPANNQGNASGKQVDWVKRMGTVNCSDSASHTRRVVSELESQIVACRVFPRLVSVAIPEVSSIRWLAAQSTDVRIAWSNRDTDDCVAGSGVAVELVAHAWESMDEVFLRCRAIIQNDSHLRMFGGFPFASGVSDAMDMGTRGDLVYEPALGGSGLAGSETGDAAPLDWAAFQKARFWLPRLVCDGRSIGCVVLGEEDKSRALSAVAAMVSPGELPGTPDADAQSPLPLVVARRSLPDREGWNANVARAMQLFRREVVEKIVLARKVTMDFDRPLDPIDLTARLMDMTFGCYQFCFQFHGVHALLGATPERLFRREGRTLLTEAVAGTRPRGMDDAEDQRLAAELTVSPKDQLEHQIVRKGIRQQLYGCLQPDSLQVPEQPTVMRLARTQHLCSRMHATLRDAIRDGQILQRLHPTPAVGGYPTANALREIANIEPFDRGWYAAPVGWIGADAAEFAVAIRSGLVHDATLALFTGAGVVPGSQADAEWNEVEHKLIDFLRILGVAK